MPGDDRSVTRTVTVLVLLLLGIVALRGYLPGAEPAPDSPEPAPTSPSSLVAIVTMLVISIVIMAISIVGQARRRRVTPSAGELPLDSRGGRIKVPWRLVLIAAAVLLVWLLVVVLLARWGAGFAVDAVPATDPEPTAPPEGGRTETVPPEPPADDGGVVFGVFTAALIVLLGLSIVGVVIGRRRDGTEPQALAGAAGPAVAPLVGPDLVKATELGLAEMGDRSRDPREAIIACYAAMERELEKSPGTTPQDSDTPAEVLARAVERHALRADNAAELVDLFEEARFSPHVMNEGHRADAVRALRLVQCELQGAP